MTRRNWSHFVAVLLFLMTLGNAMVPATSAQTQITAPTEGQDYSPWLYTNCLPGDDAVFTCTWLIDSGTRERVEQEERSCNLGWSHRKATQLVTTTIVEEMRRTGSISWSLTGPARRETWSPRHTKTRSSR